MKKSKLLFAGSGIAAVGLAVIMGLSLNHDAVSKYKPSSHFAISSSEDDDAEGAAGAAQWRFDRIKNQATNDLDYQEMINVQNMANTAISNARQGNSQVSASSAQWNEIGPDNVGGRTRAILIDKDNHNHMFAGGVSGGLFESTDGGNNWTPCPGFWNAANVNLNVTTIDQAANGDIYVGTGEAPDLYFAFGTGAGGFLGGGVFKSTDHGATFNLLTSTTPTYNQTGSQWAGVNRIACDPTDATGQIVLVGTSRGLKLSTDGGASWSSPTGPVSAASTKDVKFGSDGSCVAVVSGTPWRSTDHGNSFTNVGTSAQGFYSNAAIGRTEIAFAPSDPNYVYAIVASSTGALGGVYCSTDNAQTWTAIAGASTSAFDPFSYTEKQGNYDNTIAVDPFDKKHIVVGGVELWRWDMVSNSPPSGQWTRIALEFAGLTNPFYVHSDKHAIVFHPTNQGEFFVGTDGGIFRTTDNGLYYNSMNFNYNVTQCYDVAIDHWAPNRDMSMAGCQDNGTQYVDGTGNDAKWAKDVNGGDGGGVEISYLNPNACFSTIYYGQLFRSNNRGNSSSAFYDSQITGAGTNLAGFVTPIRLWESAVDYLSPDSVIIANRQVVQNKHVTDGSTASYSGTLSLSYPTANPAPTIILDSVMFTCGNDTVNSDGAGVLSGDGFGSVQTNGNYTVTFNTTPAANKTVKAFFYMQYGAGTDFTVFSNVQGRLLDYVTPVQVNADDTVKIQDIIQSRLSVGCASAIWMTRRPIDFSTTPMWIKVAGSHSTPSAFSGTVTCQAWSPDGNHLYVGTDGGGVYRIDNVGLCKDTIDGNVEFTGNIANPNCITRCYRIGAWTSRTVTGIDVDPNDPSNVVVSVGNYGNTAYVYYADHGDTATVVGTTFVNKTGTLYSGGGAPAYCVSFDKFNPGRVLVGTEHGVYETQNITASSPSFAYASNGPGPVVVDAIRQERWEPWQVSNSGCFYIGTHGRGMWRDDSSWQQPTGIYSPSQPGNDNSSSSANHDLKVFPNPVVDNSNVTFRLDNAGAATVSIYDLSGKLVSSKEYQDLTAGNNTVQFGTDGFTKGTYIIMVTQGAKKIGTGRFLKMD
ncbi:MAG TPA: T9SS type A sorting domain-containing protein [Bacteroidia bacterium]|nr:T9SS type A sorting domain-containing protein [Bacteroidia bacterium]